jgi:hypothetical protein
MSSMSVRDRARLLSASAALLLLLAGCGQSSTSSSTRSSTSTPAQPSTTQTAGGASTTAPAAPSTSGATGAVTGSSGGVTATMRAGTHSPRVDRPWPIRFTVTRGGRAVRASVSYEYLFGGQVVAHRSHYTFTGRFADVFKWPSSAVGYPLTFRAVIVSEGARIDLDYPVQVSA